MTAHRAVDDNAMDVWVALAEAGTGGVNLRELMYATELTDHQVRVGLRRINEIKQLEMEQPIVVCMPGYRYALPEFWPDAKPWINNRGRDALTRLRTERTRLAAAAAKWPDKVGRIVLRQYDRMIEDLGELLELDDIA